MATSKLTVRHVDALGKKSSEIFNCDPDIINVNMNTDTFVAVDEWARNFVKLTTETYQDSEISQVQSINEKLTD